MRTIKVKGTAITIKRGEEWEITFPDELQPVTVIHGAGSIKGICKLIKEKFEDADPEELRKLVFDAVKGINVELGIIKVPATTQ